MIRRLLGARPAAWVAPLVPVLVGAAIMVSGGAPRARWGMHLAAGAVGLAVCFGARAVPRGPRSQLGAAALLAGAAVVAASLLGEGMQGVHRWIRLGPVLLHPSALVAPLALVVAGRRMAEAPWTVLLSLGLLQAIHVAQPDAGQATALGLAALVLVLARCARLGAARSALAAAVVTVPIALAWTRPDPLGPAPFVEDIVRRAFDLGWLTGAAALASLAALVASPLLGRGGEGGESAAAGGGDLAERLALVVYLAASLAVVLVGEFPVPMLGFGASPVLGVLAALGALARAPAQARRAGASA